ncbi:MFS general substrate transporter, partial [Rhizopogon vinicolor AM-OR11-026]
MSGTNQPPVSATDRAEDRQEDSVSATPTLQDQPHAPNPIHYVPEQSNPQKLLDTDILVVDWDGPDDPHNPKNNFYGCSLINCLFFISALGPLFLGPMSEIYGRSRVLQLANLWYLAWNLGCGFARTESQLLAFRFLAGLGGSAPLSIGGGVLGDCWLPDERGRAVAIFSLAPLLGPVIGPITGAWIAERSTWRWV